MTSCPPALAHGLWDEPGFCLGSRDPVERSEAHDGPNGREAHDTMLYTEPEVRRIVELVVDRGSFFEMAPRYGASIRVGLAT